VTPVAFMLLFEEFRAASWDAWRAILERLTEAIREVYAIAGRGSGKSRVVALLACCFAAREYRRVPGERIYIGVFAPDRKQAAVTFNYVKGMLRSVPQLAALVENETKETIELLNGVTVEVLTASGSAPRGRAYALAIIEEAAFLDANEFSADPDIELLRALRPALARVPGSLLAVIGSPYRARGVLYEAWKAGENEDTVVVALDTLTLNPTFRRREVERAFEVDPVAARSEYGLDGAIEFRSDIASLLTEAALAAVVRTGTFELPAGPGARGHFDAATGSGDDAAALGIAFAGVPAQLAFVRQWKPPFSPSAIVDEAALACRRYGIRELTIDRFAPGLVADLFRARGITCSVAARDTSATFVELLTLINSQRVTLLDDKSLLTELRRLERRPGATRDLISHPPRGHDDVAAAAANALVEAATPDRRGPSVAVFMPDGSWR
jgi:hypothetical protein